MLTTDTSGQGTGDALAALEARLDLEAEARLEAARAEAMAQWEPALKAARPTGLVAVVIGGVLALGGMGGYLIHVGSTQAAQAQRALELKLADERAEVARAEEAERARVGREVASLRERLAAEADKAAREKAAQAAAEAARARARAARRAPKVAAAPAAARPPAPTSVLDGEAEFLGQ